MIIDRQRRPGDSSPWPTNSIGDAALPVATRPGPVPYPDAEMSVHRLGDLVADSGGRRDDRRVAEFAPQSAYRHCDGVGERVGVFVPDLFEQGFGAEKAGARAQQRLQHGELLHREVELSPGALAAVSISTIGRSDRSVIIWHSVSPCRPGRSRSRTTTSYAVRSSLAAAASPSWARSTAIPWSRSPSATTSAKA